MAHVPAVSGAAADKVGFLRRAVALIVDAVLLGVVSSIIGGILFGSDPGRGNALSTILGLAYYVYFWSSAGGGQTLGMKALGIKVIKTDGSLLTVSGAVIRYVGLLISFLVLFIGVIWVAFDAQKQGWHDKIAGTYVVRA